MKDTHTHHVIPRHMCGTDDPSNLAELSVREHAEEHFRLWQEHGNQEDWIAYLALSGQITMSEAARMAMQEGGRATRGRFCSPETRRKLRASALGRSLGPQSLEHRRKLRDANIGKTRSIETRRRISEARRGKQLSRETRARMSAAAKRAWAERRAS